jgi:hypothetical protein
MYTLVIDYRPECPMVEDTGETFETIEQAQAFIRAECAECDESLPFTIVHEDEYWALHSRGMVEQPCETWGDWIALMRAQIR